MIDFPTIADPSDISISYLTANQNQGGRGAFFAKPLSSQQRTISLSWENLSNSDTAILTAFISQNIGNLIRWTHPETNEMINMVYTGVAIIPTSGRAPFHQNVPQVVFGEVP